MSPSELAYLMGSLVGGSLFWGTLLFIVIRAIRSAKGRAMDSRGFSTGMPVLVHPAGGKRSPARVVRPGRTRCLVELSDGKQVRVEYAYLTHALN